MEPQGEGGGGATAGPGETWREQNSTLRLGAREQGEKGQAWDFLGGRLHGFAPTLRFLITIQ